MEMNQHWDGWWFDRHFLVDPAGNAYNQNDIRSVFFTRQLHKEIRGTPLKVLSLKRELERRIRATALPEIIVRYGDGSEQTFKYKV